MDNKSKKETGGDKMKSSKMIFACVCLIGLSQLVWSQNNSVDAVHGTHGHGVPGYLDPRTGAFTTQTQNSAVNAKHNRPPLTGTAVFFREQFNITIQNFDQSSGDVVACQTYIYSQGDANGEFYDTATVFATRSGGTLTCDVPILTLWTLQTPTTDTINAYVYVEFLQGITLGPTSTYWTVRESEQPPMQLTVPFNGQTVTNIINFEL